MVSRHHEFKAKIRELQERDAEGYSKALALYRTAVDRGFLEHLMSLAARSPEWATAFTKLISKAKRLTTGGRPSDWKKPHSALHVGLSHTMRPTDTNGFEPLAPILFPGAMGPGRNEDGTAVFDPSVAWTAIDLAVGEVVLTICEFDSAEKLVSALTAYLAAVDSGEAVAADESDQGAVAPVATVAKRAKAGKAVGPDAKSPKSDVKELARQLKTAREETEFFRGRLGAETKKLNKATTRAGDLERDLAVAIHERDNLRRQLDTTLEALAKTDEARQAAERGNERLTNEIQQHRQRAAEMKTDVEQAQAVAARLDEHAKWQEKELKDAKAQVAARDQLLEGFHLDNLSNQLDTIGSSIAMMQQLFGSLEEYKAALERQKAKEEADQADYDRMRAEAEEKNERLKAWEAEQREGKRTMLLERVRQFEDDLVAAGDPDRVIIDGHNMLFYDFAQGDEASSREYMLELLDRAAGRIGDISPNTLITVVFDSQHNSSTTTRDSGVRVEYAFNDKSEARGTSGADARIVEMIEEGHPGCRYVVLSNDRTDVHASTAAMAEELGIEVAVDWVDSVATYLQDIERLDTML